MDSERIAKSMNRIFSIESVEFSPQIDYQADDILPVQTDHLYQQIKHYKSVHFLIFQHTCLVEYNKLRTHVIAIIQIGNVYYCLMYFNITTFD